MLHEAAFSGQVKCVGLLLRYYQKYDIKINGPDSMGYSPFD